jgi:hypothetical protein
MQPFLLYRAQHHEEEKRRQKCLSTETLNLNGNSQQTNNKFTNKPKTQHNVTMQTLCNVQQTKQQKMKKFNSNNNSTF